MAALIPLCFPDVRLTQAANEITVVDAGVRKLADELLATMYEYNLIGMAATHVGVPRQLIVLDVSTTYDQPQIFINPRILEQRGSVVAAEAGIALPTIEVDVERASWIKMSALTIEGVAVTLEAENLLARALQHEIDQMNGILFIDRLSKLKRERAVKKFLKNK